MDVASNYTDEKIMESLLICGKGQNCKGCIFIDDDATTCRHDLIKAAANNIEEYRMKQLRELNEQFLRLTISLL